jgi:2-polyprenyl-3-methyl-5-hydroxy-6-metoxy-1,4-benzoquinol methylase
MISNTLSTRDAEYANYLIKNQSSLKSWLFQFPYRTHLKGLRLSRTLDIGCGAGRNLKALTNESVGIDHNPLLVKACVDKGLTAYSTDDFLKIQNRYLGHFHSILISHVAEHMTLPEFTKMLGDYRKFLSPGGRVVVICPQEKGYQTDSTHVEFMDFESIAKALRGGGYTTGSHYSFPFPRGIGKVFSFNEFVVIGRG